MAPHLLAVALALAPPTIAVPGLNGVRLAPGEIELYAELLSQKLTEGGLKVFTTRDVQQMLGIERQQQLLGCSEGSNCIVEMVGALGVDGVLIGDIGALGDEYVLNFKILSASKGSTLALYNARATSVKALPDELEKAARALLHQVALAFARPDLDPKPISAQRPVEIDKSTYVDTGSDRRKWAILPAAIGIAAVVVGIVLEALAHDQLGLLQMATTPGDAQTAAGNGSTYQTAGYVLVGVGAAALVGAGALALFGRSEPKATAGVVLTPNGAGIMVQGSFP